MNGGLRGLSLFHLTQNFPSAKAATQREGIDCVYGLYLQGNILITAVWGEGQQQTN